MRAFDSIDTMKKEVDMVSQVYEGHSFPVDCGLTTYLVELEVSIPVPGFFIP